MKGRLITFEGIDGCGKTTQIKMLEEYLLKSGCNILILREPGGTAVGEKIRNILLDRQNNICSMAEALLYASSRAQLVSERIIPEIERGKIVLLDRFVDSSYVYQGYARGLGMETIIAINNAATKGIRPDITIYIDITPEEAIKRRGKRTADRLEVESLEFHKRVYEGYQKLIKLEPDRFAVIDGMQDTYTIHKSIVDIIKNFF